jgi:hypothetical protein
MTMSTYSSPSSNKISKLSLISILLLSLLCLLLRPVEVTAKLGEGTVAVTDVNEKDLTSISASTVEYSRARTTAGDRSGGSSTTTTTDRSLGVGYNKKPYRKPVPRTYKKPYRHHPNRRKPVPNNRQYYVKKPVETPPGGRHNGHYYIKVPVSKPTPHYDYNNNNNYNPKTPVYKPKPNPTPQSNPTKRPTKSPTKKPEPTNKPTSYSNATPKPTQYSSVSTPTKPTATPNAKTPQPTKRPTKRPTVKPTTDKPTKRPTKRPTVKPTTDKPTKRPTKKPTTANAKSDIPTDTPTLVVWPLTSSPTTGVVVEGKKIPPTFGPSSTVSPTINLPPAVRTPPQPEKTPVVQVEDTEPSKIQLRIQDFALGGGEEFNDPTSYQSFALRRVEEQLNADQMTTIKLLQYYSLYCIYEATSSKSNEYIISSGIFQNDDIPGWKVSTGWLSNNLDPCDGGWFGVACDTTGQEMGELFEQDGGAGEGKIINLDLFDNSLTGNFPPEVVLLASDGFYATGAGSLVALDIFNNEYMSNNNDNSWIQDLGSQLGKFCIYYVIFTACRSALSC